MSNIFTISDLAVERWVELNPIDAFDAGFVRQPVEWPDYSPAGHDRARAVYAELLDQATACDTETADEAMAKRVLVDELSSAIEEIDNHRYTWNLNNLASPWQEFGLSFDLCTKETNTDWEAIATLLETLPVGLETYLQSLALGIELGFPPAKRQVSAAIEQGRHNQGDASPLTAMIAEYDGSDAALAARLTAAAITARAGFGRATDWLENTLLPVARPDDGVGEERYGAAVKSFLGTELNLRATYDWAWTEIASLTERLTELTAQVDNTKSVAEVMELLKTDPSRAAHGVDEFLQAMRDRQQTALDNLAGVHFDVPDEIRAIAVKSPPEGGATAAYYTGPSVDFSRPGCVWYPIYGRTSFPLYDEVTTAYHEGFPGHHLQIGFARTLSDRLSQFHQLFVWHPGSGEGWALYAERLMGELGYLELPDYEIGLITSQLFRSCRVVIDIGVHLDLPIPDDAPINPGGQWDFDTAVTVLRSLSFAGEEDAASEVTRYMGWPGQAISYKLGEQAIVNLRHELEVEPQFDLKQFHTDVLTVGAVGLDVLSEQVRAAQRARWQ